MQAGPPSQTHRDPLYDYLSHAALKVSSMYGHDWHYEYVWVHVLTSMYRKQLLL